MSYYIITEVFVLTQHKKTGLPVVYIEVELAIKRAWPNTREYSAKHMQYRFFINFSRTITFTLIKFKSI